MPKFATPVAAAVLVSTLAYAVIGGPDLRPAASPQAIGGTVYSADHARAQANGTNDEQPETF